MKLKSLQRTDLVPGNDVVEVDGSFYRIYKIETVSTNVVILKSTYIIFRGSKYQEEIDGTIYRVVASIDRYNDTEIRLFSRDSNINIDLLLEEEKKSEFIKAKELEEM